MKLVLDTNAYSDLMRGKSAVQEQVRNADHIYLPAPVVGELLYGFQGGDRRRQNQMQLHDFIHSPVVTFVPTNQTVCERFALILNQLKSKGRPIPTNDVWIAAHTLALGADLLSADQHFSAVDGLSWLCPTD